MLKAASTTYEYTHPFERSPLITPLPDVLLFLTESHADVLCEGVCLNAAQMQTAQ